MNIQDLLSQFAATQNPSQGQGQTTNSSGQSSDPLSAISSMLPGGLLGGAAAGGVMALLLGSKAARKVVGNVATIGGTALLGGLAWKAYENWKDNKPVSETGSLTSNDIAKAQSTIPDSTSSGTPLNLVLVKSMIAAARSDGHLDSREQKNIFDAVEKMDLDGSQKAAVFDAMSAEITVEDLAREVTEEHQKAEVYLAALLAIEVDHEDERAWLDSLATALQMPQGLAPYLEEQARVGIS